MTEKKLRENAWSPSGKMVTDDKEWVLHNNQRFGEWVNSHYNDYRLKRGNEMDCFTETDKKELFRYQKFIKAYMDTVSPYRGILLYHGLGSGKTRSSIEVAQQYAHEGKFTLFISKAKLIYNFAKELAKWGWTWEGRRFTQAHYRQFISQSTGKPKVGRAFLREWGIGYAAYNAPNKLAQLREYADKDNKLKNLVIIIDEVHNLVQNLYNGINHGKNAETRARSMAYYRTLLMSENCRFVTLSGTPIINRPTELSILFNILRGPIPSPPEERPKSLYELFPIDEAQFDAAFVNWDIGSGMNLDVFKQRIQGLVSFYSGARGNVFPTMVDEEGNPTDSPIMVEVPMGYTQAQWYEKARKPERKQTARSSKINIQEEIRSILTKGTSYRVKSRMAGLFGFDEDLGDLRQNEKLNELYRALQEPLEEDITEEELEAGEYTSLLSLENLHDYSSKMAHVIDKIDNISPEYDGGVLIYSNYRTVEGINLMAKALEANDWINYEDDPEMDPSWDGRRFAILGSDADRNADIIKLYNSEDNLFDVEEGDPYTGAGRNIRVLLGTEVISEGVDLFNIRQVHILEPHWNMVRVKQTIGRARRICSHKNLPPDLWNFIVWIYLATANENVPTDPLTTDQVIHTVAERKEAMNQDFFYAMREAAVDCHLNANHNTTSGKNNGPVNCMTIPRSIDSGPDDVVYAYWPDYHKDLGHGSGGPGGPGGPGASTTTTTEVTEIIKKIVRYTQKIFPPRLLPELWERKMGPSGRTIVKPRYVIEATPDGKRLEGKMIKYQGKPAKKYQLYDMEAYESQQQLVPAGHLLEFKRDGKTQVIYKRN